MRDKNCHCDCGMAEWVGMPAGGRDGKEGFVCPKQGDPRVKMMHWVCKIKMAAATKHLQPSRSNELKFRSESIS